MIPQFDFHNVFVLPWTQDFSIYGWVVLMGFLVALTCGLVGNFLVLRRMALVADAISHSVLPGLAVAFLISKSRGPVAMFAGALFAGLITTVLIEFIHRRTRIKQDAAIGIVFSSLFALGVVLISLFAGQIDLDTDCVLYGQLEMVGVEDRVILGGSLIDGVQTGGFALAPPQVLTMAIVCLVVIVLLLLFYRQLLVSSFDPGLAATLGIRPALVHYALMAMLSVVVVSAFRSVGAVLVVAMIILPGATSYLLVSRLPAMLLLSAVHAALSAVLGLHLGVWLNCSFGAAMVVAGAALFVAAWLFTLARKKWRGLDAPEDPAAPQPAT